MKLRLLLASTLLALAAGLPAQTFDTLRYQTAYQKHFQRDYYGTGPTVDPSR